ncbi:MAG: alpha/beta fold hydrolase [Parvibaculales bacterium]
MAKNKTMVPAWDASVHFVESKQNPTPQAADSSVGMLKARDGALLRNAVFVPENPRGTVVLMTGYSEFIEKYFETISDLLALGYAVVMPEWRGHGLSDGLGAEPTRLHLTDFPLNVRDLEDRWPRLMADMPRPFFGLAHSMGGHISLRAAHDHPDWFDALAQSAPMHGIALPGPVRALLGLVTFVYRLFGKGDSWNPFVPPHERPGVAEENRVTNDFDRFNRGETLYVTEPHLQVNGGSLDWLRAAFMSMKQAAQPAYLRAIETPLYIGTAEEELLVDNAAHAHALAHLPNGDGKLYRQAKHELLMEKDATRQAFLADVEAFYQKAST